MGTSGCIRIPDLNVRMSDLGQFDIPIKNPRFLDNKNISIVTLKQIGLIVVECLLKLQTELDQNRADPDQTAPAIILLLQSSLIWANTVC